MTERPKTRTGIEIAEELNWRDASELWLEYGIPREDSVYKLIAVYLCGWESNQELIQAMDLVEALESQDNIGGLVLWKNPKTRDDEKPFQIEVWQNITYSSEQ